MKRSLFFSLLVLFGLSMFCAVSDADTVKIISFEGEAAITPVGQTESVKPREGMSLNPGDRVTTGGKSFVKVAFDRIQENIVKVDENSDVIIRLDRDNNIELVNGDIYVLLRDMPGGSVFKVRTPSAVCGVRGTGWHTMTDGAITAISVFEGSVFTRGINKDGSVMEEEYWTEEGYERKIKKHKSPGKKTKMSKAKLLKLKGQVATGKKKAVEQKVRSFDRRDIISDERRESIIERKSDERIEKIRDSLREEKEDSGGERYFLKN